MILDEYGAEDRRRFSGSVVDGMVLSHRLPWFEFQKLVVPLDHLHQEHTPRRPTAIGPARSKGTRFRKIGWHKQPGRFERAFLWFEWPDFDEDVEALFQARTFERNDLGSVSIVGRAAVFHDEHVAARRSFCWITERLRTDHYSSSSVVRNTKKRSARGLPYNGPSDRIVR